MSTLFKLIQETLEITLFVAVMMILVDILNVWTKKKIETFILGRKSYRQYFISSLIGTVPGCIGGFTNVSLYMHGLISFGALAGSMIAVSGDEAFVMLSLFPGKALFLFAILFLAGIFGGWCIDLIVKKFNIKTCQKCGEMITHPTEKKFSHYIKIHIYGHIIKKHLWKTAIWTFGALAIVEYGLQNFHLAEFTSNYKIMFLFLGALIGLIPESGPHLIFVSLFSNGLIPFSVLLTSSIVQDGHGMLPMLAYSVKDSLLIKGFNMVLGLTLGLILFFLGW
jgi:hypothetical protein